mmetsp:Transcript_17373/g.34333  ORF Transcript_17373/g.34333 Transcript_17373/m.34333 type:complete len:81 (+) Transcript_17373:390-632(+)
MKPMHLLVATVNELLDFTTGNTEGRNKIEWLIKFRSCWFLLKASSRPNSASLFTTQGPWSYKIQRKPREDWMMCSFEEGQ